MRAFDPAVDAGADATQAIVIDGEATSTESQTMPGNYGHGAPPQYTDLHERTGSRIMRSRYAIR